MAQLDIRLSSRGECWQSRRGAAAVQTMVPVRPFLQPRAPGQHKTLAMKALGDQQEQMQLKAEQQAGLTSLPADDKGEANGYSRLWDIGLRQPGDVLGGKYTVVDVLGSGSNAMTYRATSASGTEVAVKALSLRSLRDWKQLDLFQREARTLAGLSHPSIPRYLDYFEEDSERDRAFYIVQEVARGKSLSQMLLRGLRPDEAEVRRIAAELLAVLGYLGDLRPPVVHRDIKPENVVLEGGAWGGRVFLVDFGGVQGVSAAGSAAAASSTVVGTFGFMAPEQFRGAAVPASDLYALGGTLLFLLSGRPPSAFPEERMRVNWRSTYLAPGTMWPALLDGLLEPVAEDRLTAVQALALLEGRPVSSQIPEQRRHEAAAARRAMTSGPGWVGSRSSRGVRQPTARPSRAESSEVMRTLWRQEPVTRQPAGSRVVVEQSGDSLDISIPPKGFSGDLVATGTFALAWNAFVAFWTFSALASGGIVFALFSAPFWFAGASLAREALGGALVRERLVLGAQRFRLGRELALLDTSGKPDSSAEGKGGRGQEVTHEGRTSDLQGARVVDRVIINGQPYTAIELVEGVNMYRFGEGLETVEQRWLVHRINSHLEGLRGGAAIDHGSMMRPDYPRIQNEEDMEVDDPLAWALDEVEQDSKYRSGHRGKG